MEPKTEGTSHELTFGEGIVLGMDETGRVLRSARNSVTVCLGSPGTGKTMGVVNPTIAASPQASMLIHDSKPELLANTLALGSRDETKIFVLDPRDEAGMKGAEALAFNPLHPAFHDGDTWGHMLRMAKILIPERNDGDIYFQQRAQTAFAAIATYLTFFPEEMPQDGHRKERIVSLPGIVDWTIAMMKGGIDDPIRSVAEKCRHDEGLTNVARHLVPLISMAPTERSAILGTMDQGLLVAKNAQMRQFLEPQDAAEGAAILQAFSDPARPATVFLSGQQRHMINAPLHAMAIEVVGRWRSQSPFQKSC